MNITTYFERIAYDGKRDATLAILRLLHQHHVMNVSFEDLDIHIGREIKLTGPDIYNKVVKGFRGGFCYELNFIFNSLLHEMGYKSDIISARTFDVHGLPGPLFDHMCILVDLGEKYLADVGFGDLFLQPIEIKPGIQSDGRNYFKIDSYSNTDYSLSMSATKDGFVKKYIFSTEPQELNHFAEQCSWKQYSQDSYFVRNKVCTRATPDGRVTIFNDRFIITKNGLRSEQIIVDEYALNEILKNWFNISL